MTPDSSTSSAGTPGGLFVTTQWTRVLASRGDSAEARQALSDLCAAYYQPVFVVMRRSAPDEDAARDLTQEFFARLLGRHGLDTADPRRGHFRHFLLGAIRHFLADVRDHQRRLKRGGGLVHVPLHAASGDDVGIEVADQRLPSPDLEFDRKWALTLLDRALTRLGAEQAADGKAAHFEALKPWLTGDRQDLAQADAAKRVGLSEGAIKVAIHRLRKRFRELVRDEIAGTVDDPAQVREEFNYLLEVLS